MSEYEDNSYGKIYSDFANRLSVIAQQYDELKIDDEHKYESTLYICVLQNLLTQVNEIKKWANHKRAKSFDVDPIWENELPFWGIELSNVIVPKEENIKVGYILDELRDTLSHPLPVRRGREYTSVSDLGKVVSYTFSCRNQQDEIVFEVNLSSQKVKDLVNNLSDYLSKMTKEITEMVKADGDYS